MNTSPSRAAGAAAILLCLHFHPLPARAALTVSPSKPGNVFWTTETVAIPVSGTAGTKVDWTVTDFFGTVLKTGSSNFSGGAVTIQPNITKRGWFALDLSEKDAGGVQVASLRTTFAILTSISVSGMQNSPFGVMTHFAQFTPTGAMDLMTRAGIAHFRDEQYWESVEIVSGPNAGDFSFPSKFTNYMSAAATASLKPFIALDWSHPNYDWDTSAGLPAKYTAPYTETGRAGYANYALNVLDRYPGQIGFVEGWNEYNAGTFIKGPAAGDKGLYYSLMMQKLWEVIKPEHPTVKIVVGASVPVTHGFFKAIFDNGGLPYMDALSVHPYRGQPEGVDLEIQDLDALVKSYNGGVGKPIWASEFSKTVTTAAGQADGASYVPRIVTQMLSAGVERMYYYLLQDDGNFPYRGLIGATNAAKGNFVPNPAYVAYAVLIRELYGWTFHSRVTSGVSSTTYIYRFDNGTQRKYVCWATAPVNVSFSTGATTVPVTDIMGNVTDVAVSGGAFPLGLVEDVAYVTFPGNINGVTEGFNPVVADSVADYGKTQGANGWYYGRASVSGSYSPSSFTQLSWSIWNTQGSYRWLSGNYPFITIEQMHPSSNWAVRRWVSDVAGLVRLTGNLSVGSTNDGVRTRIFVDGVEQYNQLLTEDQAVSYDVPNVTVGVGSKVDFAVDRVSNESNDATAFSARISWMQNPQEIIVDNSDGSGVTVTGAWTSASTTPGYYGSDYLHDGNSGKGSKSVRFTPNLFSAGNYEVFARWTSHTNRASNVPIDIVTSGGTELMQVDQRTNGGAWVSLGIYHFNAGTGGSVLVGNTGTNGYVIADAVKFVYQQPPAEIVMDNSDASGVTITGSWTASSGSSGYYGSDYLHDGNTGQGTKSVRFTPDLASAGNYEVFARWTANGNRANNVPIDIVGSGGTATVTVNQRVNGGQWNSLGTHSLNATGGSVLIRTTGANGYVIADAVRFVPQ